MKRTICLLTILLMLTLSLPVMAAGRFSIVAESVDAIPGGTVTVKINAASNPGMAVGKIKLSFDSTMLVPVSVSKGSVLTKVMYFTSNLDDQNIDPTELEHVTITWMNMADIKDNGTLAEIEFTVKDTASGSSELGLEISQLADAASKDISVNAVDGAVNISGGTDEAQSQAVIGFSSAAITRTNDRVSGSIDVSAYSEKDRTAVFIYTIYDDEGQLRSAKTKNVTIKAGANDVKLGTVETEAEMGQGYYVKVYIWDDLNKQNPVAAAIIKACD